MKNVTYRLDRTKFKMQTFKEADNQYVYWSSKTLVERLMASYYLISVAYDFDLNNPPRLDRSVFKMRKHGMQ